jgi:hypothetical protein
MTTAIFLMYLKPSAAKIKRPPHIINWFIFDARYKTGKSDVPNFPSPDRIFPTIRPLLADPDKHAPSIDDVVSPLPWLPGQVANFHLFRMFDPMTCPCAV